MLKQIEGSLGVAEAVALCRPEIICATRSLLRPISSKTSAPWSKKELLKTAKFLNVESEIRQP